MLNVHPALLPAFGGPGMYGARVHRAVLDARRALTGPTVHFVDEVYDHGPIIAQWPVPVFASDDAASLAARVLRAEHLLYPRVVDAVAGGEVRLDAEGRVAERALHLAAARRRWIPCSTTSTLAIRLDAALGPALRR